MNSVVLRIFPIKSLILLFAFLAISNRPVLFASPPSEGGTQLLDERFLSEHGKQPLRVPKISPLIDLESTNEKRKVWVLFTDKGAVTASNLQEALDWYQARMPARVKRRRKYRAHQSRPDFTDLPLESRYVEAVLRIAGKLRSKSRWLNGIGLEATPEEIRAIARFPFVGAIDPILQHRETFHPPDNALESLSPNTPSAPVQINYGNARGQITQIQADFLHQKGFLGEGVVIGLLDTGFSLEHTALQPADVIAQHDFVNGDENPADEIGQDDPGHDGHGSVVLGVLAGNAPGRLMGVAYRAGYLLAKTEKVSENGRNFERQIEEDWWIAGLEWLEEMGADVVNSSLGYSDWYRFKDLDGTTSKLTIAANLAVEKGMPVLVAAGNKGGRLLGDLGLAGRINVPADGLDVLAIGAVDRNGRIARFSAHGPTFDGRIKPDLMTLGSGVTSINSSTRTRFSSNHRGTSVSTPLATGVVALLLQAFPLATPKDITRALRSTASQAGKPDNTAGYGIIHAKATFEALLNQFGHTGLSQSVAVESQPEKLSITLGGIKQAALLQNYPNPFNAETWMPFRLAFPGRVTIRIHDLYGRLINRLELGELPAGDYSAKQHAAHWDGRNLYGEPVVSGAYFYILELLGETHIRKMIVLE